MGKIYEQTINQFNGGISNDLRVNVPSKFAISKHFDIFSYTHKLIPQLDTVANEVKSQKICKFVYAPWLTAGANRLFGLGVVYNTTKPAVFMWDIDSGAFTREVPINNESGTTRRSEDVFFYYKGFIYMWAGSEAVTGNYVYLQRFDCQTGTAFSETYYTTSTPTVAQPVYCIIDDCAYFFHDNFVSRLNDTTWSPKVLTLPSKYKIVAGCVYGNYLAIACTTKGVSEKKSVVYLWDRDSSIATVTSVLDFGQGEIKHLALLNNKLIAIIDHYLNDSLFGFGQGKIIIKSYTGGEPQLLNEILSDETQTDLTTKTNFVRDNKIYFPANPKFNGDSRLGVWVVDEFGNATIAYTLNGATSYEGIYMAGNMWWLAHSGDGSVDQTTNAYSTTNPSIYETLKIGDASKTFELKVGGVKTDPLPANGRIVLSYRINEESDWTEIFDYTEENSVYHEAINIEATGANFEQFHEMQFQVKSYKGAVVTGIYYKLEEVPKNLSD